uniref:Crustacean hyperglycemic hormone n=1 Tax=Tigriopus japonicus TaxID=158387 RepID=W8CTE3_TIGJA|nr:crustacean hyperglycemic hormone [Tigriopus japonicus]
MSYHCRLISLPLPSLTSLAILALQIFLLATLMPVHAGLMSSNSPFRFRFNGDSLGGLSPYKRDNSPQGDNDAMELEKATYQPSSQMLKRDYEALQCRGMYDLSIFTKLNRICEDCFNLYHDAEIHELCRSECFSSFAFRTCLQSLLMEEESDFYLELVDIVGKKR